MKETTMNTEMTMDMTTLDETELRQIDGGIIQYFGAFLSTYVAFLREVEANPQDYTWTMDWYYSR
jgi:hypothetical protein